ncbi:MAG: hypothetical protein E7671_00055 [Ruminococcaceae bacterium]|nr:hypothetical protein [Oscillospiraceae bacterium]
MKKSITIVCCSVLALVLVMAVIIIFYKAEKPILSQMSPEECVEFIRSRGIENIWEYEEDNGGEEIREIIKKVEDDPNIHFVYGRLDLTRFSYEIKHAVNDYYGVEAETDWLDHMLNTEKAE